MLDLRSTPHDWAAVLALFRANRMGGRSLPKLERAFHNSTVCVFAYDGDRLVGCARALSDGEYHTLVYDVAVAPDMQRRHIGRQLMEHVHAQAPAWRTMLVCDDDVRPFYQSLGYETYAGVMARLEPGLLTGDSAAGATMSPAPTGPRRTP